VTQVVKTYRCCGCGAAIESDLVKRCYCATRCAWLNGAPEEVIVMRTEFEAQLDSDIQYLESADVHSDEGPLGEPAARSILAIALRYARFAAGRQ
jgi:hypothetical protein